MRSAVDRLRRSLFCLHFSFLFVVCIPDETLRIVSEKEDIVNRVAAHAAELYLRRPFAVDACSCSLHSCAFDFDGAQCNQRLGPLGKICDGSCEGQLADTNRTIIRTPPGTDLTALSAGLKESICTYRDLESLIPEFHSTARAWTYLGTTDGHFRRWPASGRDHDEPESPLSGCRSYDPRTRPWYIAASTGPKDVLFLIDKSGSMRDPQVGGQLKWNTTVDAVVSLIDTLGNRDYFNIVAFADEAIQLWTSEPLAQGTPENRAEIKSLLGDLIPDGGTNFDAAFRMAFSLFKDACHPEVKRCSGCEKVIIFLTDGKDTSRSSDAIRPSVMAANLEEYQSKLENQTDRRASIFTFSLGRDADDSIPRQIACRNSGSWSFIDDEADPLTAMRSFYLFLTARRRSAHPVWTQPYVDDSGLGEIVTVAKPIFLDNAADEMNGIFLGVAGHDVLLSELGRNKAEIKEALAELRTRDDDCVPFETDACQLQVMRNVYTDQATCVDQFPVDSEEGRCFTNERSYYKRFAGPVGWHRARDLCREDEGMLVSVGSDEELAFVASMASDDGTWIGARRTFSTFTWQDNASPDLDDRSPYWGIGQPHSYTGVEDCVRIDTRGPSANLNNERCGTELTFICEYSTEKQCTGEALNPREGGKGFFTVPPVDRCVNTENSFASAATVPGAADLTSSDVVCPLGDPRPDAEFRCCENCGRRPTAPTASTQTVEPDVAGEKDEDGVGADVGMSSGLAIAITSIAFIVTTGTCIVLILFFHKRQDGEKEGEEDGRVSCGPTSLGTINTPSRLNYAASPTSRTSLPHPYRARRQSGV